MKRWLNLSVAVALGAVGAWWLGHTPVAPAPIEVAPIPKETPKSTKAKAAAPPPTFPAVVAAPPPSSIYPPGEAEAIKSIHARFATGDFVGAATLADELLAKPGLSTGAHSWVLAQLPALLASAGWARLKLGDCDEALTWFARADALGRRPETLKGLAVCHYKQKNIYAAREAFGAYLEKNPEDLEMQILGADLLESDGRYEEAAQALEAVDQALTANTAAAAASGLDKAGVRQRLAGMRGRAKEGVKQLVETSRNFRLSYRAGDHEDLVAFVLETLEDALDEFVDNYGFRAPNSPIEVGLYPAGDFKSVVPGGPDWAEGLFDGRLRIPLKDAQVAAPRASTLQIVLRHELVHALLAQLSDNRSLPPWLDEGLAQRLSCPRDGCGPFRFPPTPGAFLPESGFLTPYVSYPAVQAGRAYSQALYLVGSLERRYGDEAIRRIVSGLGPSTSITSDGLLQPLGLSFTQLRDLASQDWDRRFTATEGRP